MSSNLVAGDARVLSFDGKLPRLSERVFLAPGAAVIGDVSLGASSSVWYNAVVRGDVHWIRIGSRSNLQDLVVVHVSAGTHPVSIGDRVTVGHAAVIHGCTIEDGVLIGMGAKILDGARIGAGAMIGAGSVVSPGAEIPPGVLALGAPARVRRELSPEERTQVARASDLYVEYALAHARELGLLPRE